MWKRWSTRTPATPVSEESKPKDQPVAALSLDEGATKQQNEVQDKAANEEPTQAGSTLQSSETDRDHESHSAGVSASEVPAVQDPAGGTVDKVTESASAPITDTHISPPPAASPVDQGAAFPAQLTSPVEMASGDAGAAGTPDTSINAPAPPPPDNSSAASHLQPPIRTRRLSFRSFAFFYGRDKQPVSTAYTTPKPQTTEHVKPESTPPPKPKLSRSQREALSSAVVLRTLIMGPSSSSTAKVKARHSKFTVSLDLKKVKGQLLKPKSANAIISELRRLPLPDGPSFHVSARASSESLVTHPDAGGTPIHAVCLACTDEEAEKLHFSRLRTGHNLFPTSSLSPDATTMSRPSNIGTASLESLVMVLRDLNTVSLLASPDLGFGQPVTSEGDMNPLAGSVPSAAAVVTGFEQITKQLMMLGFATSKAVFPSHEGIYPPTDRMSLLTYWWGLELVLPEPSIKYLGKAKSISNTLLNFLSALAIINNGVREVLPFIRYVANFVDFEWSAIQAQDKGQGVVCAATWVMPAAMVPRAWDFPTRPATISGSAANPDTTAGKDNNYAMPNTPAGSPQPNPATPTDLFPVAPSLPMMPQLMVTPATLPRDFPVPDEAHVV